MEFIALLLAGVIGGLILLGILTLIQLVFVGREYALEIVLDSGYVWWFRLIMLPIWAAMACFCFLLTLLVAWGMVNMVKDAYQWLNSKD